MAPASGHEPVSLTRENGANAGDGGGRSLFSAAYRVDSLLRTARAFDKFAVCAMFCAPFKLHGRQLADGCFAFNPTHSAAPENEQDVWRAIAEAVVTAPLRVDVIFMHPRHARMQFQRVDDGASNVGFARCGRG